MLPDSSVSVLGESLPIDITIADNFVSVVCDDVIAKTFTTPTLSSWSCVSMDMGDGWVYIPFAAVTAGSPCRVKFKISKGVHPDLRGGFSSPEQLSPHISAIGSLLTSNFIEDGDRGIWYDLYWSWTSGMSVGAYTIVLADAVYVPSNGEGNFPASG